MLPTTNLHPPVLRCEIACLHIGHAKFVREFRNRLIRKKRWGQILWRNWWLMPAIASWKAACATSGAGSVEKWPPSCAFSYFRSGCSWSRWPDPFWWWSTWTVTRLCAPKLKLATGTEQCLFQTVYHGFFAADFVDRDLQRANFKERFEADVNRAYEQIHVPRFGRFRSSRILHDFKMVFFLYFVCQSK